MPSEYKPNWGTMALTASTTLNADAYAGKMITLSSATGLTVTLPAATGTGATYEIIVITALSSGSYVIKVANSTDVTRGIALVLGSSTGAFAAAATDDTITFNGTTTGGAVGTRVIVRDVASGTFAVDVMAPGSGTIATPFSATV